MSSIPFVLNVRPHKCLCGKPCPSENYKEGYEWLHGVLVSAGYDQNVESPEGFAGRVVRERERIEELERLLAARVEHCSRVHGCRQEVS